MANIFSLWLIILHLLDYLLLKTKLAGSSVGVQWYLLQFWFDFSWRITFKNLIYPLQIHICTMLSLLFTKFICYSLFLFLPFPFSLNLALPWVILDKTYPSLLVVILKEVNCIEMSLSHLVELEFCLVRICDFAIRICYTLFYHPW